MARRMFKDTRKSRKVYLFPLKLPRETWHTAQQPMLYIKHPWQGKSKDEAGRKPPSTRAQNIPHLLLPTFRPLILESRTARKYIRSNHNRTAGSKERLQNHSHGAFWDTSIGRQFNEPNSFLQFIMFFLSCAKIQWIIHVQSIVYIT